MKILYSSDLCFEPNTATSIFAIPNNRVQSERNRAFPFIHTLNIFEAHTGNLHRNMQMRSINAVLPTVGFVYSGGYMSTNNLHKLRAEQQMPYGKLHTNTPTTPPPPFAIEGFFDRQKRKPNFEYFVNARGFIVCKMSYAKGGVA